MKNQHIDWLNAQDTKQVVAPVEGHEGYRVVKAMSVRDLQQHDFAGEDDFESPTHEDCEQPRLATYSGRSEIDNRELDAYGELI